MDQDTLEYLEFGVIAMVVLSLLAVLLLYLNRLLDRRAKARLVAKVALRQATRLALSESSAVPQLPPLPTYEEVLQVEHSEEGRFRRPPLFQLLNAQHLAEKLRFDDESENSSKAASCRETVLEVEMPPPVYQTTIRC